MIFELVALSMLPEEPWKHWVSTKLPKKNKDAQVEKLELKRSYTAWIMV